MSDVMTELIDVLDENGNKTGEVETKEEIYKRGYGIVQFIFGLKMISKNYWFKKGILLKIHFLTYGQFLQQVM